MVALNKILVAAEMFVEAHNRFTKADHDIDYITSILLSGSVVGIVGELLKDQGGKTTHQILAKIANHIAEPGDEQANEGLFRAVYNSLKHAGDPRRKIKASLDLEIHTDLRIEAARMLNDAKSDFCEIKISVEVKSKFSSEFVDLLGSGDSYA